MIILILCCFKLLIALTSSCRLFLKRTQFYDSKNSCPCTCGQHLHNVQSLSDSLVALAQVIHTHPAKAIPPAVSSSLYKQTNVPIKDFTIIENKFLLQRTLVYMGICMRNAIVKLSGRWKYLLARSYISVLFL